MVDYHLKLFAASGLHLLLGTGRFVEPRVIEVTGHDGSIRRVTAPRIYVNLGTDAAIPAVPGLAKAAPLTHVGALKLDTVPERLLVLGGGYIGMELAQAFRRLGSTVVIIEHGMQLAAREDGDVATAIQRLFAEDGIELALNATPVRVDGRSGESVTVTLENGASFTGSHVLVAAGRTPRTAGVGLEVAGVALDARGFIKVDQYLQTTAPGIWGLGESAGSPMFTHVSMDDYRVVKSGITGGTRSTTGRLIPYCVFIDPEFARVGLSEREAHDAGIAYRLATLPVRMIPRAQTLSEQKGFMKALVGSDGHILGFAMLGAQAGEVMTSVQMAMLGRLDFTALRDGIIAHPTLAEGLNMLFSNLSP
jgi:pyruvate/2-oxoglutarate dehydrogenase complex dihydrolipoamide dehydrogenase (E3) component